MTQQQPLNNGPLQPTVIGQSQNGASPNEALTPNTPSVNGGLSAANSPLNAAGNSQASQFGNNSSGWGQSSSSGVTGNGFPADFNAIRRGTDLQGVDLQGAGSTGLPAPLSPTGLNPRTGQDYNPALPGRPANPWANTNDQTNNPTQALPPANTTLGDTTLANTTLGGAAQNNTAVGNAATDGQADHPNHDPAFHVDDESQIDRGHRTDGTGISLGAIRNPDIAPLNRPVGDDSVNRQTLQPIQANAGQGNAGQGNAGQGNAGRSDFGAQNNQADPAGTDPNNEVQSGGQAGNDQFTQPWSMAGRQNAPAQDDSSRDNSGQNHLQQDTARDQASFAGNTEQSQAAPNNRQSMRDMLGQQSNGTANGGFASDQNRFPTAAPRQDANFLQRPGRLSGTNNFGADSASTNNAAGNPSMFSQQNSFAAGQQGATQSPVIQGDRGDYATGNAMLPRDQAAQMYNGQGNAQYNAAQNEIAMREKQQILNDLPSAQVKIDRPSSFPGAFEPTTQPQGQPIVPSGTPVSDPSASRQGNDNDSSEVVAEAGQYQNMWNGLFFLSISTNLFLWYLLYESRNNYRDLADDLQDRFFRETE